MIEDYESIEELAEEADQKTQDEGSPVAKRSKNSPEFKF